MKKIKQAVILAGGQGTRLRPFTYKNPKAMIPINKRPFLEYLNKPQLSPKEVLAFCGHATREYYY